MFPSYTLYNDEELGMQTVSKFTNRLFCCMVLAIVTSLATVSFVADYVSQGQSNNIRILPCSVEVGSAHWINVFALRSGV